MSRVITSPGGGKYVERALGGGVVERRWIVPEDAIRPGPHRPVAMSRAQPVTGTTPASAPKVEFREYASPRYEVELAGNAAFAIEREVADTYTRFGGFAEQGGYLFSRWRPGSGSVVVSYASAGVGPGSRHWQGKMQLPQLKDVEGEFSPTLRRADLVPVGDWHSHPSSPRPSSVDVACWVRQLRKLGVLASVSLIVSPGRDLGWECPEIGAWVTGRAGDKVICEPAILRDA
jgi:hypothetical protein